MKLLSKVNEYLNDTNYQIIITNSYINLINYLEVIDFSSSKISIRHSSGITVINGKDLVISKMVSDEILITGIITYINLKGEA